MHRQEDLEHAAPTHLGLHLATGLLVAVAAVVARPIVAAHYDDATARALIALAVLGLLENAGHTPRILLEKELEFPALVRLDVANVFISNLAAIGMAAAGLDLWALVGKQALAWLIQTAGAWRLAPRLPGRRPTWTSARWFLSFGKPLWIAGLATFVSLQFDDFLVGSLDSTRSLGFYARAYALASLPTVFVTHIVARVAFPLYAKLQHDREKLSTAFVSVLRVIVALTAPMGIVMALTASEFVPLLFGETWRPMIPLIRWLLLYAGLRPIYDDCGELFTAIGEPGISSRILLLQAVFVLVACPPMTWAFGAVGAAIAVGISLAAGVVRAYQMIPRYVNLAVWQVFRPPLLAGAAGLAAAFLGLSAARPENPLALLAWKTLLFLGPFALVFLLLQYQEIRRDLALLRKEG
ncbi:MAG: oligosaccharide flippase family protein [Deltaproteobacteria bacterium]|nr:oligosaccharide flippase family protein [Deltaproteobacteria bacterium]